MAMNFSIFALTAQSHPLAGRDQTAAVHMTRRMRDTLLSLILGAALYTLAFPPYEWSWAAWCALAPLFLIIREQSPRAAFFTGVTYGVLWCLGQGYWLYGTMTEHFAFGPVFSVPFLLANFLFFSGLPIGLVSSLSCILMRSRARLLATGGVPALWVCGEFVRANSEFGVSWGILGYTQYRCLMLIQIADLTSVYGVSFLLALSGYTVAELWDYLLAWAKSQKSKACPERSRRSKSQKSKKKTPNPEPRTPNPAQDLASTPWSAIGLLLGSVMVTLSYGAVRLHQYATPTDAPPLTIAIIQGDAPAEHRWQPMYYASTLLKYASVTSRGLAGARPDLTIWPEFAISFYLDKEPLLRAQLGEFARTLHTPLLLGAPRLEEADEGSRYYNSAYLFSSEGALVEVYDKLRLVPFAEHQPFSFPRLLAHTPEAPSEFTPGTRATVFPLPSSAFGVTICYEAAYPSVTRRFVQEGARFLVNISNDTWLGGVAAAVEQHFAMNVLRAVENKRSLVRVATAGISGFVDPTGRPSLLSTALETALHGQVAPRTELTLYNRWGDWFSCCCLGFSGIALAWTAWNPGVASRTSPRRASESSPVETAI
jgi:apolipoprotein N-acyltransferase